MDNVHIFNQMFSQGYVNYIKEQNEKKKLSISEIDNKLIECKNKIDSIKAKLQELKENYKALKEDYSSYMLMGREVGDVQESFQQAVQDLKLEYEDVKATTDYYKDLRNKTLMESDDQHKDNNSYKEVVEKAHEDLLMGEKKPSDVLADLFEVVVPSSGKASTVGGEIVRALMKVFYSYYKDNNYFYKGEGINDCGSAVEYLKDTVDGNDFDSIVVYNMTGEQYVDVLEEITHEILTKIVSSTNSYFDEPNTNDFTKYSVEGLQNDEPVVDIEVKIPLNIKDRFIRDEDLQKNVIEKIKDKYGVHAQVDSFDNTTIVIKGVKQAQADEIKDGIENYVANTVVAVRNESIANIKHNKEVLKESVKNNKIDIDADKAFLRLYLNEEFKRANPQKIAKVKKVIEYYGEDCYGLAEQYNAVPKDARKAIMEFLVD